MGIGPDRGWICDAISLVSYWTEPVDNIHVKYSPVCNLVDSVRIHWKPLYRQLVPHIDFRFALLPAVTQRCLFHVNQHCSWPLFKICDIHSSWGGYLHVWTVANKWSLDVKRFGESREIRPLARKIWVSDPLFTGLLGTAPSLPNYEK